MISNVCGVCCDGPLDKGDGGDEIIGGLDVDISEEDG